MQAACPTLRLPKIVLFGDIETTLDVTSGSRNYLRVTVHTRSLLNAARGCSSFRTFYHRVYDKVAFTLSTSLARLILGLNGRSQESDNEPCRLNEG